MRCMEPSKLAEDVALIEKLGGPAAVAKKLKLPPSSGVQTVQNWKTRGIPPKVKLSRPDLFLQGLHTGRPRRQHREEQKAA